DIASSKGKGSMDSTAVEEVQGKGFVQTLREDNWWIAPVSVVAGLLAFIIYSTWAAFEASHYFYSAASQAQGFGGYLSPLYSPPLFVDKEMAGSAPLGHAWLGSWPSWWPTKWLPPSPSFLILIFPGLFRFTCYYYRKAYYRAFAWTPPACAVGAVPQRSYKGESKFLLFQNLHRYALYIALIYLVILSYDAVQGFFMNGVFGVGLGSIILLINPILLGGYTLGCHSFRHLVGGRTDRFSCGCMEGEQKGTKASYKSWRWVSILNQNHQFWAWASLIWVAWTDIYIRLVSSGVIIDPNTWTSFGG
ncbi:MAG: hypothetical protein ABEH38_03465, partial [Flavobacteriales bacterium]